MDIVDKLDEYLGEDSINEGIISNITNKLSSIPWNDIKNNFSSGFDMFSDIAIKAGIEDEALEIINNMLGTRFMSLDDISSLRILESKDDVSDISSKRSFKKAFSDMTKLLKSNNVKISPSTIIHSLMWVITAGKKYITKRIK